MKVLAGALLLVAGLAAARAPGPVAALNRNKVRILAGAPQTYDPADRPTLQDGEKIRYSSRDWAGNVEAARTSAAAQVDLDAPSTTDDVPTGDQTTAPRVTLTASDAGGSGVASTRYLIGADPVDPTLAGNDHGDHVCKTAARCKVAGGAFGVADEVVQPAEQQVFHLHGSRSGVENARVFVENIDKIVCQ